MSARILCGLTIATAAAVMVGCGPSTAGQMRTFEVTGKVTYAGSPVPGATVTFAPATEGNPAAFGRTEQDGTYSLTTYNSGDGAVAGEYIVTVTKSSGGSSAASSPAGSHEAYTSGEFNPAASHGGGSGGAGGGGGGSLLPEKYGSRDTTPLRGTVTEGENAIDLTLE